mmetsp:Transcript_21545/g.45554  ORF Transcript_21545/g.45554 Transcript_21545/m.45554 type:complete len:86 (+) Transcript_21545:151-408(+)
MFVDPFTIIQFYTLLTGTQECITTNKINDLVRSPAGPFHPSTDPSLRSTSFQFNVIGYLSRPSETKGAGDATHMCRFPPQRNGSL